MSDSVSKNKWRVIGEDTQHWSRASTSQRSITIQSHLWTHTCGWAWTYIFACTHIHGQFLKSLSFSNAEWTWKYNIFTWRSHNQFYHVLYHLYTVLITRYLGFLSVLCHEISTDLLNIDSSWHLYEISESMSMSLPSEFLLTHWIL